MSDYQGRDLVTRVALALDDDGRVLALRADNISELRRRNLIEDAKMPYANPFGMVYDSGRYAENTALAMQFADWSGFDARRAEARARGTLLGLGLANYVESSVGTPREQAQMTVRPEGIVEIVTGTQSAGQGHETSFAQVAAARLELDVDAVRIRLGDADVVGFGGGTHSGRSMRMAGAVIALAAGDLITEGKRRAARALEAAEGDIAYARGRFSVVGTDRGVDLFELPGGLAVVHDNEMHEPVFPNGCHVCEVEVDPETGAVRLVRYAAVDDVGRPINPLIVDGQTHGGIVQGVGQAMGEACIVDGTSGQTLTASLMDYAVPRAADGPAFATRLNEVPSPTNPLGVKAGGEGGTTPAPAVVVSAIADALRPLGVTDIPLPATPYALWRAIRAAQGLGVDYLL